MKKVTLEGELILYCDMNYSAIKTNDQNLWDAIHEHFKPEKEKTERYQENTFWFGNFRITIEKLNETP